MSERISKCAKLIRSQTPESLISTFKFSWKQKKITMTPPIVAMGNQIFLTVKRRDVNYRFLLTAEVGDIWWFDEEEIEFLIGELDMNVVDIAIRTLNL